MKDLKRSLIVNLLVLVVSIFLFKSVSYSASDKKEEANNKDLLINTGNMQVVLNIPNEKYEFLGNTFLSKIDQKGYDFSVKNIGNMPIEYYEIRLVDQENKVSTLSHKYLNFTINKDNEKEESVKNLGDNDSILYSGYNLKVGDTSKFNLRMWINSEEIDVLGKELYGAIEVTLYQKYDVYKNYVLYESTDSTNVPIRTSVYNPITSTIPVKEGYRFVGWETNDGLIKYNPGDTYQESIGTTLYARWEKV